MRGARCGRKRRRILMKVAAPDGNVQSLPSVVGSQGGRERRRPGLFIILASLATGSKIYSIPMLHSSYSE